jgi:serpin B
MSVKAGVGTARLLGAGLWATVAYEDRGNLALSPFSVAVALGMTLAGAEGQTRSEIEDVLGGGTGLGDVAGFLEGEGGGDVVIDAANALFAQAGLAWRQEFLDTLADVFGAEPRMVDYAETEPARSAINGWTADRTRDRIPEIVPTGVLTPECRLVLVNALYFKAPWAEPFWEHSSADADFHLDDGSTVTVPTMRLVLHAATGTGDAWRALRLDYAGGRTAMTLLLPDPGRQADVEALLAAGMWEALLEVPDGGRVDVSLPRFTFRTGTALGEHLAALGMPTAFTDAADFSGMTDAEPLKISEVFHQVFIAVDEAGTEAAAATAVVMQRAGGMPASPEPFVVDRPFLFVIHDVEHGTPLFVGRVADPRGA